MYFLTFQNCLSCPFSGTPAGGAELPGPHLRHQPRHLPRLSHLLSRQTAQRLGLRRCLRPGRSRAIGVWGCRAFSRGAEPRPHCQIFWFIWSGWVQDFSKGTWSSDGKAQTSFREPGYPGDGWSGFDPPPLLIGLGRVSPAPQAVYRGKSSPSLLAWLDKW